MFRVSIKFILILLASYIFAIFQGGNLPYRIFHGLLITFLIGFVYILMKQKEIKIKVKSNTKIYSSGEEQEFITIINNFGFLPAPYVLLNNKAIEQINPKYNGDAVALNPADSVWVRNIVKFNKRGLYNFGEMSIKISDLFCVFERTRNINLNVPVKVYPKVYELSKFTSNGSDIFKNALSNVSNIEDLYSTKEIRKYNIGDNLKKVNWKVSAKHGELFVKNPDMVSGEESNIFLDMSKSNILISEDETKEEQLIDMCTSIINHMQLRGIKTKLFINTKVARNYDIKSRSDFIELMEFFLTQKSDSENDFSMFINSNINKIPRLSWIGIITTNVNRELKDNLLLLKDKGYNITVFYSAFSLKDITYNEILKKSQIECLSLFDLMSKQESKVKI